MSFNIKPTLLFLALSVLSPGLPACSGSQPQVNTVQQMTQRLQGNWTLRSYRPSAAMELPIQLLLAQQLGQMKISMDGSQLIARGPGVEVTRTYRIIEVVDQTATVVVTEPTGVSIRVWVELWNDQLRFRPMDAPWTGEGTLQRNP